MMKEVYRLLDIKQSATTPYHAMGNGLVKNVEAPHLQLGFRL